MSTEQAGGHPDTTAVVGFSAEAVERLLRLAEGETIEILRPPGTGLMMMTVHDAFGTPFHLGEVLVTEAEVGWGGLRGYGQVCGDDPGRALARACAEVILRGEDDLLKLRIRQLLEAEEERTAAERSAEETLVAATRVQFDLMPGS